MTFTDVWTDNWGTDIAITLGIDVSHYQGTIDWAAVSRTSYQFALARMSIGRTTLDTRGRANLKAMLDTMPVAGAYGVVGYAEPVEDGADLLLGEILMAGADPAKVLVMLDAENFGDGRYPTIDQVDRYARRLKERLSRWPIAYVPAWWLSQHGYTVAGKALSNCPWAPSHYLAPSWTEAKLQANKPTDLHGFKTLAWLQYTSSAQVAGISGNVDANAFYGGLAVLREQLLGQQEDDMTTEEHNALMWLRDNATLLRDQGVRMTDHGDPDVSGRANNLKAVRADIETLRGEVATINAALAAGQIVTLSPEQLDVLKAALPTLEGSALIQLAVSPPAP